MKRILKKREKNNIAIILRYENGGNWYDIKFCCLLNGVSTGCRTRILDDVDLRQACVGNLSERRYEVDENGRILQNEKEQ